MNNNEEKLINSITYGEVFEFFKKLNNTDKINLYIEHRKNKIEKEKENKVLKYFSDFIKRDIKLKVFFLDEEKTVAIVKVELKEKIIYYIPCILGIGIGTKSYNNWEDAIIACLLFKKTGKSETTVDVIEIFNKINL